MQIDRIYIPCVVLRLNDQFFLSHFRTQLSKVSEETLRQIKTPSFFALCRLSGGYRSVTRVNAAGGDEYICRRAIHSILNVVRIDPTPRYYCVDIIASASHLLNVSFPSARNFPQVK